MGINKDFLNWCEIRWKQELKSQRLSAKLSNEDIDFLNDQYEQSLKADMLAMLTDIQLEIEELDTPNNNGAYMDCSEIIQQKIDALRGKA